MRARAILMWTVAAVASASCSDEDRAEERVNRARHAARFECPTPRFGMACDPDSSGDLYGECDGLCTFDTSSPSGRTVCVRIAELGMPHLENYLCGDGPACTQTCNQTGSCVAVPAVDGTACSEPGNGNKCARQCSAGSCQPIVGATCPQGRDPGGCGFQTCAPFAATQCVTVPYPTTTACSGGTCDGCGACSSSGPGACVDGGPSADASADAGPLCGNGVIDTLELCDLTNLGAETCESVTLGALPHGTLRCSASCTFDLRDCSADAGAGAGGAGDGSAGAAGSGTSGAGGIAAGGSAGSGTAGTAAIDAGAGTGGTAAIDASAGAGGIDASAGSGGTVAIDASAGSSGSAGTEAGVAGSGGLAAGGTGGLAAGGTGGLAAGGTGGFGTGGAGGAGGEGGADAGPIDGSAGFGGFEGGAGSGGTDGGAGRGGAGGAAGTSGSSGAGGGAGLGGGTAGGTGGTSAAGTAGAAGSAGSRVRGDGYVEGGGCDCRVGRSGTSSKASELGSLCGVALVVGYWRRRRRQ